MKTLRSLLLVCAALLVILAACAPAATGEPHPAPAETEAPSSAEPTQLPVTGSTPQPTAPVTAPTVGATLPEQRLLSLEWPRRVRVGDSDTLRLTLEMDEHGSITPTAEFGGNEIASQPIAVQNLYETHTVQVEAQLNISGMHVEPQGLQVEQLFPGRSVTFYWSISPNAAGLHRGSIEAVLAYIPKGTGVAERYQILARPVQIQSTTVIGLPAGVARWAGFAGSGLGFVFSIPFFESLLAWLWRRRRTT